MEEFTTNREISIVLGEINQNVKTIRDDNCTDHKEIKTVLKEHNGRLTKIEKWRERIIGIGWAISIVVSILSFVIGGLVFPLIVRAVTSLI